MPDSVAQLVEKVIAAFGPYVDTGVMEGDPREFATELILMIAEHRPTDIVTLDRAIFVARSIEQGHVTAGMRTVAEALERMRDEAAAAPRHLVETQGVVHIADSGIEHLHERLDAIHEKLAEQWRVLTMLAGVAAPTPFGSVQPSGPAVDPRDIARVEKMVDMAGILAVTKAWVRIREGLES